MMNPIQGLGHYGLKQQQASQGQLNNLAGDLQGQLGQQGGLMSPAMLRRDAQDRVDKMLAGVEPDANGKITMDGVTAKKDELIASFEAGIKEDLAALGVDPDIEFTLSHDERTNSIAVSSDHPQAEVVQQYFDDHPERAAEFAQIRMLERVADMARNPASPSVMRKQMQLQFMDELAGQGYVSGGPLNFGFAGGGMLPMRGVSLTV